MIILIIFLLILIAICVFMVYAYRFYSLMCNKNDKNVYKLFEKFRPKDEYKDIKTQTIAWLATQPTEDVNIKSNDGLNLHGVLLKANNPYRTIILVHGYRGNCPSDFSAIIPWLNQNHCNVLMIDQRCCGSSEGKVITFGAKEKEDVKEWVKFAIDKIDNGLPIYLFGVSMGASTVLSSSIYPYPDNVKGYVADCGYTSMEDICSELCTKWMHLPKFPLIPLIKLYTKLFGHFDINEASTKEALERNERPVMLFHGTVDTFVDPENSRKNYAYIKSFKELEWFEGAEHAVSMYVDNELYTNKLKYFFDTVEHKK